MNYLILLKRFSKPICVESNEEGENPLQSYLLNSEEIILISQVPTSEEIRKKPSEEAKRNI